jgi:hypothetical protein
MNTANYTATDSYPLTTEGLDFIQKQILILEQTAAAYGNGNWILQGMTDNSGILSSGVVAIVANDTAEIVEYDGGDPTSTTKWSIQSTTTTTPNRTVKKLVADENGTITGLTRIDIKARLATINSNVSQNTLDISDINATLDFILTAKIHISGVVNDFHEYFQFSPADNCSCLGTINEQPVTSMFGTVGHQGPSSIVFQNGEKTVYECTDGDDVSVKCNLWLK